MITIDWNSLAIGAAGTFFTLGFLFLFIYLFTKLFPKKPKYDLHNLKKLIYETGIKTNEVYKNIQQLEKFFKEIENV